MKHRIWTLKLEFKRECCFFGIYRKKGENETSYYICLFPMFVIHLQIWQNPCIVYKIHSNGEFTSSEIPHAKKKYEGAKVTTFNQEWKSPIGKIPFYDPPYYDPYKEYGKNLQEEKK